MVASSRSRSNTWLTRCVSECIAASSSSLRWKSPVVGRWNSSDKKAVVQYRMPKISASVAKNASGWL